MIFTGVWRDCISYEKSLELQEELKKTALTRKKNFALGFFCNTSITLGLRGGEEDLLLSKKEYENQNIPIISVKRGGQATLHSPGQLVIYPISEIKRNKLRAKDFVSFIEKTTQKTLEHYGVKTHKEENQAGLFTKKGKIAFFGIHITEGVSQHGLSVNIHNDLNLFSYIRSCGTQNRPHDKLSFYRPRISLKEFFDSWIQVSESTKF